MLAQELDKDDPNAILLVEAVVSGFIRSYRLQDAEACLKMWRAKQPDNTQALLFQGIVHHLKAQLQDAIAVYRRLVSLDPEHQDARMRLVDILLDLSQAQEALSHLEMLRDRMPDNLMVLFYLGRCCDQLGKEDEAIDILNKVLARQPDHAFALGELGKLALRKGRLKQAETCLSRACALSPGDKGFHYQYYQCLKRLGKADQARIIDQRVLEIENDLKKIQDITLWEMQHRPHDADLHFEVGRISLSAGQEQEALRWFHSALKENPRHARTHAALGQYYQRIGELGRAQEHRKIAKEQKGN
jgi:tetratricopeptide (TPR) repeat protein